MKKKTSFYLLSLVGFFLLVLMIMLPMFIGVTKSLAQTPSDGSLPPEFMESTKENALGTSQGADQAAPKENFKKTEAPDQMTDQKSEATSNEPPAQETADSVLTSTALTPEEYVYDPEGRRDPFRPYKLIRSEEIVKTDKQGVEFSSSLEPLQTFEIEQLKVIGILWDVKQPRALITDSNGKIHTLLKNTKVGRRGGFVSVIREGEVVVTETYEDEDGQKVSRTKVLELKQKE